jgi:hypothetical protein
MRHTIGSSFDWVVFGRPTKLKNKIDRALIIILALIFLSGSGKISPDLKQYD